MDRSHPIYQNFTRRFNTAIVNHDAALMREILSEPIPVEVQNTPTILSIWHSSRAKGFAMFGEIEESVEEYRLGFRHTPDDTKFDYVVNWSNAYVGELFRDTSEEVKWASMERCLSALKLARAEQVVLDARKEATLNSIAAFCLIYMEDKKSASANLESINSESIQVDDIARSDLKTYWGNIPKAMMAAIELKDEGLLGRIANSCCTQAEITEWNLDGTRLFMRLLAEGRTLEFECGWVDLFPHLERLSPRFPTLRRFVAQFSGGNSSGEDMLSELADIVSGRS